MWHVVHPTGGSAAIGVELRAPNDSWESHADLVFGSIMPLDEGKGTNDSSDG